MTDDISTVGDATESDVRLGPRATVLIPCYGRAEHLSYTLKRLEEQTEGPLDVLVVDDCSPGPEIREVASLFTFARYLRNPVNGGVVGARNFGARHVSTQYIVNLDDDSWFVGASGISDALDWMDEHPRVGVLALNILPRGKSLQFPEAGGDYLVPNYIGCGNVYRRNVIDMVGPYLQEFWRQGEELERSIRVYSAGYEVRAVPSIVVYHDEAPQHRNATLISSLNLVNSARRELVRAPLIFLPFGLAKCVHEALKTRALVSWKMVSEQLSSEYGGFWNCLFALREPVSHSAYLRWWFARWQLGRRRARAQRP